MTLMTSSRMLSRVEHALPRMSSRRCWSISAGCVVMMPVLVTEAVVERLLMFYPMRPAGGHESDLVGDGQFVELLNSVLPVAPVNFAEFVGLVNAVRFMEYVNFAELVEGRQG